MNRFYNPNTNIDTKLPSGQNLFLESPFEGTVSSYRDSAYFSDNTNYNYSLYALTSNGPGPIYVTFGTATDITNLQPNQIEVNHTTQADKALIQQLNKLVDGGSVFNVTSSGNNVPLTPATMITHVDPATGVVTLSADVTGRGAYVYTFTRPVMDYSASAIMSLWYSWANYYVNYVTNTLGLKTNLTFKGEIKPANSNQLVLNPDQPGVDKLVPGMTVTNGGINGGAIILAISPNGRTITLSKTAIGSGEYTFAPPSLATIAGSNGNTGVNPIWKLLTLTPTGKTAIDFSQAVYEVMNSMSNTFQPGGTYPSVQLLANIIGANVAKLPGLNPGAPPEQNIETIVTNQIKSLLRGVPDFTSSTYSDPSLWYPNPAVATGGQSFNVYNLDPFVWFVHEKLGLSGYGFSVDDDISFVGAKGSTHVDMTVGGLYTPAGVLNGLSNPNEWTGVAPYGPVKSTGKREGATIVGLDKVVVNQVLGYDASTKVLGVLVNGPGVKPGTTVVTVIPTGEVKLSEPLNSNSSGTFYFFAPVVGTGTVGRTNQAKDTIVGLNKPAYDTLQKIGPLKTDGHYNIQVTGPGIQLTGPKTMIQSVTPVSGKYVVTLTRDLVLGSEPAGSYAYTFGHANPYPPMRLRSRRR